MTKFDNSKVHPFDIEPGWLLLELIPKPEGEIVLPGVTKERRDLMIPKVIDFGRYPGTDDYAKDCNAKMEGFIGKTVIHYLVHPSLNASADHPFYAIDYGKRHFAFIRPNDIIAVYKDDAPILN